MYLPPKSTRMNACGQSRLPLLVFLLICLGLLAAVAANRQSIIDWQRLRGYQAPAVVRQLADQDTMTPQARKVFYVNHPSVVPKSQFSQSCPNNGGEQTIVLGCYRSNQNGVYLLAVDDSRLNGVEQVTAAHEMLHAAYDRLSNADRAKVNALLLDYYHAGLHDPRLVTTIAAYKKSEPNDLVNEMHSIFGTEVTNLPPPLEQYYRQYFTNRAAIVAFASSYQAEFGSRVAAVAQDDAQLAALKSKIDNNEASLRAQQAAIETAKATLNAERSEGQVAAYNANVPVYNAQIDAYNALVATTQNFIVDYNQLVTARNALALEEDQLANDLNANAQPLNH